MTESQSRRREGAKARRDAAASRQFRNAAAFALRPLSFVRRLSPFVLRPLSFVLVLGLTVFAQSRPQRIISLVPAATEILFSIGAGPRVVAVSSYDREPAAVNALPRVGALIDPNVERILSLKPDLVVIYGTQHDLKTQLDRAGIPHTAFTHGGLREVTAAIRALGARTGDGARAESVAKEIEQSLAAVAKRVEGRPRPRTLLVFGREPGTLRNMYASGGLGFLHDMLVAAGGENVFADQPRESVQVTTEMLLTLRPDVVLELHASDGQVDLSAWQTLPSLPAVRDRRVIVLAGSELMVPGPRIAGATERFARALHPGAF
jgi:iron complex transport system substrate-binding protein